MTHSRTVRVRLHLDGSLDPIPLSTGDSTLVVVQPPKLHILEVARFSFFEDREILLPDVEVLPADVPGPDRVAGIEVAAAALRFLDAHPEKRLLVVGHTDTVGSKKDNKQLSTDRAKNVHLYLGGDLDAWAAHCQKHHEVEDVQSILNWISATFADIENDPVPVDGDLGPLTWAALQIVRDACAERTGVEPWSGKKIRVEDWKGFGQLYDEALAARIGSPERLRQLRERAPFTSPAFVGLGERYPTENPTKDEYESERNRRVDLIFLDPEEYRFVVDEESVEEYVYAPDSLARREWLPIGFPAHTDELAVRVQTEDGEPVVGVECVLTLPDGQIQKACLDAAGVARFRGLPPAAAEFRMPSLEALDWDAAPDSVRPLPPAPEQEDEDEDDVPDDDNLPPLTAAERAVFDLDGADDADDGGDGDDGDGDD